MKTILKCIVAAWVAAAVGGLYAASEVWVDKSEGNDLTGDGTSVSPYATIQKGVDEVDAGGTVWVRPGTYDTGERADATGTSNRVYITKSLCLNATGSRDETIIKGSENSSSGSPLGPAAVRCVSVATGIGKAEINGFTLEGGCSQTINNGAGDNANLGGGVYGNGYAWNSDPNRTAVSNCVIKGCCATRGGAAYNCRLFRCFVTDCHSSNVGNVGRNMYAYNCVFFRNGNQYRGLGGASLFAYTGFLYNCTVVENGTYAFISWGGAYNSIFLNNKDGIGSGHYAKIFKCVIDDQTALDDSSAQENGCVEGVYADCIYAPLVNDFRLVKGCVCEGTGNTSSTTYFPVLSRGIDFLGNPRLTGDSLNIGAVQASVDAGIGTIAVDGTFAGANVEGLNTVIGGRVSHANVPVLPATVKLEMPRVDNAGYLWSSNRECGVTLLKWDDTVQIPAARRITGEQVAANTMLTVGAGKVLWVDRVNGNDDTGSYQDPAAHPYQSIQAAADLVRRSAWSSAVIYVKSGTYDNGGSVGQGDVTNRVYFGENSSLVRLVAVDGPANTVIKGAASSGSATGCGPGAVRCIESNGGIKLVSGFTVEGGRTETLDGTLSNDANNQRRRGGAFYKGYGTSKILYVSDCEIKDCTGEFGSIAYDVVMVRCRIHNSGRYDYTPFVSCSLVSCVVWDVGPESMSDNMQMFNTCWAYNTTIGACNLKNAIGSTSYGYNSVFATGKGQDVSASLPAALKYCLYESTLSAAINPSAGTAQEGSVKGQAGFKNGAAGDMTLVSVSSGQNLANYDTMSKGCPVDVFGVPFTGTAEGRFEAGGVAGSVPGAVCGTSYDGGVSPEGLVALEDDGTLSVSASKAAVRPLIGFEVNGELVETRNPSYVLRLSDFNTDRFEVRAVYGTEFFVDAVNGSESNSGHYADDAKLYIASALALTESGDTVVALPGVYDKDTPTSHSTSPDVKILSRVVVPTGRTLKSRDGAGSTVIAGALATEDKGLGCGTDAVRCVYLSPKANLIGFTLRGGRTDVPESGTPDSADCSGGGIFGNDIEFAVASDCIITNCASFRGGGARNVCLRRCRIVGNKAGWFGSAVNSCFMQRCFLDGNIGGQTYVCFAGRYENCTFGPNNLMVDEQTPANIRIETSSENAFMRNCIFTGGYVYSTHLYNCAFATGMTPGSPNEIVGDIYGEVQLDGGGAPVIGHNVGIDAANEEIMSEVCKSNDLVMCSRIWNGARDMGAIEVDWREHYARSLADRRMTVSDAPESAKEQPDGKIRLVDGELTASWAAAQGRSVTRTLRYSVPGNGTLTVTLDGTVVDTVNAGETKEFVFRSGVDANALSFSYSPGADDELGALLGSFSGYSGTKISFR